jgi:hypothetical protein
LGANRTAELSWKSLAVFESSDLVRRQYRRRHDLDLTAGKARGITTALTQGLQYFAELRTVGELARPGVLLYGVMALSRAAILFFKPAAKEANLDQGHGLTVLNWQQTLAGGIKTVPNLRLKVANGTFTELAEATPRVDRASVYAAPYPKTMAIRTASPAAMPVGWSMSLRDLLGRIPELHNIYEDVRSTRPLPRPRHPGILPFRAVGSYGPSASILPKDAATNRPVTGTNVPAGRVFRLLARSDSSGPALV